MKVTAAQNPSPSLVLFSSAPNLKLPQEPHEHNAAYVERPHSFTGKRQGFLPLQPA